jgi:DNA-binding NarL/FixJ family response regulator
MIKRISIIEPHAIFRVMLKDMVQSIDGFKTGYVLDDLDGWLVLLHEPSDILLMDLEVSKKGVCPCDVISRLAQDTGTATIALSLSYNEAMLHRAFESGAVGYLLKDSAYAEFRANLELALAGGVPLSSLVARQLIRSFEQKESQVPPGGKLGSLFVLQVEGAIDSYLRDPSETCCSNLSDYLSRKMNLSYSHIATLYRERTGITLGYQKQLRRVEHVKRLLQGTDQTLTQIAETLGFSSVAHLSTFFHRMTGMKSSDYRRYAS